MNNDKYTKVMKINNKIMKIEEQMKIREKNDENSDF